MRHALVLAVVLPFLLSSAAHATSCEGQCDPEERLYGPLLNCGDGTWGGVVCARSNGVCEWQYQDCVGGPTEPVCVDLVEAEIPATEAPLARHPDNKRWATVDGGDEAILLVGPHTWDNGQDMEAEEPTAREPFVNEEYIELLDDHGHNFIRLWLFEGFEEGCKPARAEPTVWEETGTPNVYDLEDRNNAYIDRVEDRVEAAAAKNILVSVMLFQKHSLFENEENNAASPWHPDGNDNGIDGDSQDILHTTDVENDAQLLQKAYVEELVQVLYDYDNVMWEVGNEITADGFNAGDNHGTDWQELVVGWIRDEEEDQGGEKHIITVNSGFGSKGATYTELIGTGADSVAYPATGSEGSYEVDPEDLNPNILTFADTDHLQPVLFSTDAEVKVDWVWKSFLAGMHPIHMEATQNPLHENIARCAWTEVYDKDNPSFPKARTSMGLAAFLGLHVDLGELEPNPNRCSTETPGSQSYCLESRSGAPFTEYVAYSADLGDITVVMEPGEYLVTWLNAETGDLVGGGLHTVGGASPPHGFSVPGGEGRWVLHLSSPPRPILAEQVTTSCG